VPVAKDYKINLNDGSEVWLNSATVLSFPSRFTGDRREITINGEAYLKIAPDASKPFVVHLPGNTVEVTGTEFNVNTYTPEAISVSLVNGAVNLRSANDAYISLRPGRQGLSRGGLLSSDSFEERKVLSWRKGLFYFETANLQELSQVLARWFGVKTVIDDPALSNKRFAGVLYKNSPLDSFLDDLEAISKIKWYYDKTGVLHFK
ncbi:MAG: FecR domain-containing protein, partial [Bacteroidetes bacterium]|nr:FecR domain-containing protein [Bacteroidota bacterium]